MRSCLLAAAVLGSGLCGCRRAPEAVVGGLYSVRDDQGLYRVAKVVAVDPDGIHVRLYQNRWKRRPQGLGAAPLTLGTVNDADGFGIGHMALSREEFSGWKPAFLRREDISPDESAGTEAWRRGRRGDLLGGH